MGGGGGKSYTPAKYTPPALPAEPETLREEEAEAVNRASDKAKRAAALAGGRKSTILTGTLGDTTQAEVARKTLLGQ